MSIKISTQSSESNSLQIDVQFHNSDDIGKSATVRVYRHFNVNDSRGNDRITPLFKRKFKINQTNYTFELADFHADIASEDLDIQHKVEVSIDRPWLIDIRETHRIDHRLPRGKSAEDPELLMDPHDKFSFFKNLKAIEGHQRNRIITAAITAAVMIAANTLVGIHDQFSPEHLTIFYSHVDSDGDGQSPFFNSMFVNSMLFGTTWVFIKSILRKYMTFFLKRTPTIKPDTSLSASDLIGGIPRVDLENIVVRVVAGNIAHGSYERGSGSSRRTVWFHKPIRAITLFEQHLHHVPANTSISKHLAGQVNFNKIFVSLYPTILSRRTGVSVNWEVQLIHNDFVDQELPVKKVKTKLSDFLPSRKQANNQVA